MNEDIKYMKMALELAKQGKGYTSPNPAVGCVLVKDGAVISTGYHQKAGTPHAEVWALDAAGERAVGATMYVTLEPCAHYGRTPPCAERIVRSGVRRVVAAMMDPNPLVSGRGLELLRQSGIDTICGVLEEEAIRLNEDFLKWIQVQTPFITLKMAVSADGKTAAASGESQWITGEEARKYGHYLRSIHDGIVTGVNSVITDDPQLTCRILREGREARQPVRIILDSRGRIPLTARLLHDNAAPVIIIGTSAYPEEKKDALEKLGAKVLITKANDAGQVSVTEAVHILGTLGLHSLLIEGGAAIHGSFIQHRLFDKIELFMGNILLGGKNAHPAIGETGIFHLSEAPELIYEIPELLGKDVHIAAYYAGRKGCLCSQES